MSDLNILVFTLIVVRSLWQFFRILTYRQLVLFPLDLMREVIFLIFIYWFYGILHSLSIVNEGLNKSISEGVVAEVAATEMVNPLYLYALVAVMIGLVLLLLLRSRYYYHKQKLVSSSVVRCCRLLEDLLKKKQFKIIKQIFAKYKNLNYDAGCLKVMLKTYKLEEKFEEAYSVAMQGVEFSRVDETSIAFLMEAARISSGYLQDDASALEHLEKCFYYEPSEDLKEVLAERIDEIKLKTA